jgi:integrase/recombinase XerD
VKTILMHLEGTRYPLRDRAMFLLSVKAGLRAGEIANLSWAMVTDPLAEIAKSIELPNSASKGKSGRTIPMHKELKAALIELKQERGDRAMPDKAVIHSERAGMIGGMSGNAIAVKFHRLYSGLGFDGCSSHSGRRTFITRAAKLIPLAGGSLRDVQEIAGHASLATTQRYIQGSTDAKRKLMDLI